jgi:hypothetical protein
MMHEKSIQQVGPSANAVERFLEFHARTTSVPNRSPPSRSALADQHVTFCQTVSVKLALLKWHLSQISGVNVEPPNIWIPEIREWTALVFCRVKHFAETLFCHLTKPSRPPASRQRLATTDRVGHRSIPLSSMSCR